MVELARIVSINNVLSPQTGQWLVLGLNHNHNFKRVLPSSISIRDGFFEFSSVFRVEEAFVVNCSKEICLTSSENRYMNTFYSTAEGFFDYYLKILIHN